MTFELIHWPDLSSLATSANLPEDRREYIGGSDANIILSGDADRIRELWLEKRGEQPPTDLSDKLPVMLGRWSEAFNRQWFEKLTGHHVCDVGKVVTSTEHEWRRCTLDGSVQPSGTVWEAKHTNAFTSPEQVLERYMPQLQHNMAVTGASRAILAVIFGNHKYEIMEVASDWLYQEDLLAAEKAFWNCVVTGRILFRPVLARSQSPSARVR